MTAFQGHSTAGSLKHGRTEAAGDPLWRQHQLDGNMRTVIF